MCPSIEDVSNTNLQRLGSNGNHFQFYIRSLCDYNLTTRDKAQ